MRTWHVLTGEYPPQSGGVSDYTRQLARRLVEAGDRVEVWAPPFEDRDESRAADPGVTVHRLPDHFGPRSLWRLTRALNRTPAPRRVLVQYVPHAFGYRGANVLFCLWLRSRRRECVWVMFHEVMFLAEGDRRLSRIALAAANRLMARLVAGAAERAFVSIPGWRRMLEPWLTAGTAVTWLPVPSTIPVIDDPAAAAADSGTLCGGRHASGRQLWHVRKGASGTSRTDAPAISLSCRIAASCCSASDSETVCRELTSSHPSLAGRIFATGRLPASDLSRSCRRLRSDAATVSRWHQQPPHERDGGACRMAGPTVTTTGWLTEPLWAEAGAVVLAPVDDPHALAVATATMLFDVASGKRSAAGPPLFTMRDSTSGTPSPLCAGSTPRRHHSWRCHDERRRAAPPTCQPCPSSFRRSTTSRCSPPASRRGRPSPAISRWRSWSSKTAALIRRRITCARWRQHAWGQRHLKWHHQDDLHELRCTNHGFREAKAPLLLAWQDDMFLRSPWLVPELLTTFATYADLGLLCLSRGLNCTGVTDPIAGWDDLDRLAPSSEHDRTPANELVSPAGSRSGHPPLGRAARMPRCRRTARRSVRPDRMGRSRSQLSNPAGQGGKWLLTDTSVPVLTSMSAAAHWACSPKHTNNACWGTAVSFTNDGMRRFAANRIEPRRTWLRKTTAAGWWWTARRAIRALAATIGSIRRTRMTLARVGEAIGDRLGRSGSGVRLLRPLYSGWLRAAYGRRGLPWHVNGEPFRIDPSVRHLIPHEGEDPFVQIPAQPHSPGRCRPRRRSISRNLRRHGGAVERRNGPGPGVRAVARQLRRSSPSSRDERLRRTAGRGALGGGRRAGRAEAPHDVR